MHAFVLSGCRQTQAVERVAGSSKMTIVTEKICITDIFSENNK